MDGAEERTLIGERVRLVPLSAADVEPLRAIRREPEVERWWDPLEPDFPLGDEPDVQRRAVRVGDEVAGMVQWAEELEPKYRSASIDLFLGGAHRGRGLAVEVIGLVVGHLTGDRGHHRITIDPAADNAAAVRAYAKAGFEPVGRMRLAERDSDGRGWHDALLMELVVEPPAPG